MSFKKRLAARLEGWVIELRSTKENPDACEMCFVTGWGGCMTCGAHGCDNGCRSPHNMGAHHFLGDGPDGNELNEEGRCPGCGAHPFKWTWYGGAGLGTVGPPKHPRRASRGWKERTRNEIITGPIA